MSLSKHACFKRKKLNKKFDIVIQNHSDINQFLLFYVNNLQYFKYLIFVCSFLQWRIMKSTLKSSEHFRGKHQTIFTISILKGNEGLAFVVLLAKSCSYVTAKCCMKIWEIGPNRLNSHGAMLCYRLIKCYTSSAWCAVCVCELKECGEKAEEF